MLDFSAAIFDLDGTLLDSMGLWAQIDADFLEKRGIEITGDYIQAITPLGFGEAADYTIARYGLNESSEDIIAEWNQMCRDAYRYRVDLKPDAKECLLYLKGAGIKLGVATALTPDLFKPALENNGVLHLFDAFASLEEVQRGKGFPDIYLLASQRLGVAPGQCMVFEDILAGIAGAKAGGFRTCGVYDLYSAYEWSEIRSVADMCIERYEELLRLS